MARRGLEAAERTKKKRRPSTGKKSIEHLREQDEAMAAVADWREMQHIRDTYCETLLELMPADRDVSTVKCIIKTVNTTTRRLASTDPALLAFPKHEKPGGDYGKQIRNCFVCDEGEVLAEIDMCLIPGTRVLTADLLWKPIESIRSGDMVIGIDDQQTKSKGRLQERRLRTALVKATKTRTAACRRIYMSNGATMTASLEHPWLVKEFPRSPTSRWIWKKTKDLQEDDMIRRFVDPWEPEKTWEAGWLAGILDGEGCLSTSTGSAMITITQRAGAVLDEALLGLYVRGYDIHAPSKSGGFAGSGEVFQVWLCGMIDCMHLLGTIRPRRLMERVTTIWEGRTMGKRRKGKRTPDSPDTFATILALEDVGDKEVVSLQTSTGTFVAEGFFTHNSQIEARVLAHESADPVLCALFNEGRDIHTETAAKMFNVPLAQLTADLKKDKSTTARKQADLMRFLSKKITFGGVMYGQTGMGLAVQLRMMGIEGWDAERCDGLKRDWNKLHKVAAEYIRSIREETRKTGIVRDCWGMMRYLPAIWSDDKRLVAEAERQAVNHKIQGGAQGLLQNGLAWLYPRVLGMQAAGENVQLCLSIHDSLLLRLDERLYDEVAALTIEALTEHNGLTMRVPCLAEAGKATTWGQL